MTKTAVSKKAQEQAPADLPEVNFSDADGVRFLHLGTDWVQGSMKIDAPFEIELEYVQRMMGGLLFIDAPAIGKMHAMQLGLGSAALTKFCHKKLRMKTTAIELNPQVVAACHGWFKLPRDDARLKVILADAAVEIRRPAHRASVDLLHVDLYDHEAAGPVLDSPAFYADCRAVLADGGLMTVNLFGRNSRYCESLAKIAGVFGDAAVWAFKPTREGNTVVLAQRDAVRPDRETLLRRADVIESRWNLPARKWLRLFAPAFAPVPAREPAA